MAAMERKVKVFTGHACTTSFHNALLDVVMPELSPTAWKLLCVLIRQTTGWEREQQGASYAMLMEATGIESKATIAAAIRELVDYRYELIRIIPGTQHEPSLYAINRDVDIDWTPRNFGAFSSSKTEPLTQSSGSKNEPLKASSGSKTVPLSGSKNEPLKRSSGSKNEPPIRKETNNLKQEENQDDSLPNQLSSFEEQLAQTCGEISRHWNTVQKIKERAQELLKAGCTSAELTAFEQSCKKTPRLGFVVSEFGAWRKDRAKAQASISSPAAPPRFCGKCEGGWIASGAQFGGTATRCECVTNRAKGVVAA